MVVRSQIIPDRTLPNDSTVTVNDNIAEIEGGTVRGNNLFHSFREFSFDPADLVNNIDTAYFNNGLDITHIFSRVTGNSISEINGLIKTNGSVDLFLINPNGIIFGNDAALDIGGSFVATTADNLQFRDREFSAIDPQTDALLSVNIPVGLQYGKQAQIVVLGGDLEVFNDNSLVLFGGNVIITGGNLTASQGRIDLGAIGENETIELNLDSNGWQTNYRNVEDFHKIDVNNNTSISGEMIRLKGDEINLRETSINSHSSNDVVINSNSLSLKDTDIHLTTNNEIDAKGLTIDSPKVYLQDSVIYSLVKETATGNGANLNINSDIILLKQGTQLILDTLGLGNGGNLNIDTHEISINDSAIEAKALVDIGKGGNINISSDSLTLKDESRIYTGNVLPRVTENSDSLHSLQGNSLNYTVIGMGETGKIDITANSLTLNKSQISTSVFAKGGGIIELNSPNISLLNNSQIFSETQGESPGGGTYLIADNLNIDTNGNISTHTYGGGNAGKISLQTDNILVTDQVNQIYSQTLGEGKIGKIGITDNIIELDRKTEQLGNIRAGSNFLNQDNFVFDRGININISSITFSCLWQQNYATTKQIASQTLEGIYRHRDRVDNSLVEAQSWIVNSAGNVELLALSSCL